MSLDPNQNYQCPLCGAVQQGAWPHPYGEPCPHKLMLDEAYVRMLDAQKEAWQAQRDYYAKLEPPPNVLDALSWWKRK